MKDILPNHLQDDNERAIRHSATFTWNFEFSVHKQSDKCAD